MEEWKYIEGFGDKYQVSNFGRVRSISYRRTKRCKMLKLTKNFNYLGVHLRRNGNGRAYFVHRLVAAAFLENPDKKPYVNHKNGDKYDNRAENLEWVTPSENCIHRLYELEVLNFPCPPKPVICVETGEKFVSISMAAKIKKIDQGSLSKAVNKNKIAGGFHWKLL